MTGVLIVTGGSRGIGRAVSLRAAALGYRVAVNYRGDEAAAGETVDAIRAAGGTAEAMRGDMSVEADISALFNEVDNSLGPVTALVNNAGITGGDARIDTVTGDQVTRTMAVNVVGPFLCCREAVRRMSTAHGGKGGTIVNMSSGAARLGSPGMRIHYAASKGALDTLTIGLSKEVAAEGIRVNSVRAGITDTEIHGFADNPQKLAALSRIPPMGRVATVDEIAASVIWLLSDEASYVTGALLDVGGGL